MITIEIGNSQSLIKGATAEQAREINQELSFKTVEYGIGYVKQHNTKHLIQHNRSVSIKDAKGEVRRVTSFGKRTFKTVKDVLDTFNTKRPAIYRGWVARTTPLVSPRGEVPTGLVRRLVSLLERLNWGYTVDDTRVKPIPQGTWAKPKYPHTPYPEQSEAAAAAAEHSRGVIVASTGVGKSLIISQIIANLQLRTLVVVPSLELKAQLIQTLTTIFGDKVMGKLIVVENVQALKADEPAHFDCLILDEFHRGAARTYQTLNLQAWQGIYYRFGLTATPFRNNREELILLESLIDEIIYDIPYQTAVDKGYIVPLEAYYVDVPRTECDGETWAEVYAQVVTGNDVRNALIADLIQQIAGREGKATLCIVKEIEHGDDLASRVDCAFAQGQDGFAGAFIKAFCEGKLTALIGTQGVLGEGVDTKPCEYVIAAGLGKSRPALIQMFGRCFRKYGDKRSGKVILFRDPSHRFSLAHFEEQVNVLKEEYGVVPKKWVFK
jgi:superfamily II DNA or RNA helicase